MTESAVTYLSYLKLDQILSAQDPRSRDGEREAEHDELLFIIIHQVFELWFKQLLHELDYACLQIRASNAGLTQHILKRIRSILKVMVSQLDVLETMTPIEFNAFRDRLDQASGLQSYQFRELEFLLGMKDARVLDRYPEQSPARERLEQRLLAPGLWDAFLFFLSERGFAVPAAQLQRDVSKPVMASEAMISVLQEVYRNDAEVVEICESLTDLDEGLQEWRYRHVKMVQRTIGSGRGTGGSAGAEYLMASLNKSAFPDLWAVRSRL